MRQQKIRETAFLLLYSTDMGKISLKDAMECVEKKPDRDIWERACALAKAVKEREADIDQKIRQFSLTWDLERIVSTDRNVLRLAIFELLYHKDLPIPVIVDQALKLAHKYGTDDSSRFVNGILGAIARESESEKCSLHR